MKALLFLGRHHMEMRDQPEPRLSNDEVLVRVEATGICGSDMHGYHGHDPRRVPPLIMGHEICGRAMSGSLAGHRVAVNPQIACGACERCEEGKPNHCMHRVSIGVDRAGGFADLVVIPERNLVQVPEDVSPAVAALAEPAATALHAVTLASKALEQPFNGLRILVFGGGAIGLLSALWLRALGAGDLKLAETNALRRRVAEQQAFETLDPSVTSTAPNSIDLVVDAVGSAKTREWAIAMLRPGGTLVHVGLLEAAGGIDMRRVTLAEIAVIGAFTYTRGEIRRAVSGLAAGDLGDLSWVEQRPLDDGAAAFAGLAKGEVAAPKIVLRAGGAAAGML